MRFRAWAAMAGLVVCAAGADRRPALAQDFAPGQEKIAHATRISGKAPRLDGRLDDPAWREAQWISDFLQKEPVEGAPVGEKTEVAIAYDEEALYVGARMWSADPGAIRRLMSAHDTPGNTERLIVSLDTYGDRRTAYSFSVSVTGVRADYYHPRDEEFARDFRAGPRTCAWSARAADIGCGGPA